MSTSGRYFVYILASRKYGALYTGVTGNLPARTYTHPRSADPRLHRPLQDPPSRLFRTAR
jgi:predicted GIY-YIG superfamily endonuclease